MRDLVRGAVRELRPYTPVAAGSAVDLSDNTNLWGPSPAAVAALQGIDSRAVVRYPPVPSPALSRALSTYAGVNENCIVTGCGSDDLLDCAMRAFATPGDTIAFAAPTFSMIPAFALINGLRPHAVSLDAQFDIDVDALLAPSPSLVYLCSPNNPTATSLPVTTIERVLREAPGVVLLDEAYGEFTDAPGFALVRAHERLVVTRTLSKAFGLAGLRMGYAVLSSELAPALETVRGPFKSNSAAVIAATAALTDGLSWVRGRAREAIQNRERLAVALEAMGFAPLPSQANFLCIPCSNAAHVAAALLRQGIAVRAFTGLPTVTDALNVARGDAIRITVGPWEIMEQFLAAFRSDECRCA